MLRKRELLELFVNSDALRADRLCFHRRGCCDEDGLAHAYLLARESVAPGWDASFGGGRLIGLGVLFFVGGLFLEGLDFLHDVLVVF